MPLNWEPFSIREPVACMQRLLDSGDREAPGALWSVTRRCCEEIKQCSFVICHFIGQSANWNGTSGGHP